MRSMNMPRSNMLLLATILLWALGYALWVTNFLPDEPPFALEHALRGIPVFMFGAALCLGIGRMLGGIQDLCSRTTYLMVVVVVAVIATTFMLAIFYQLVMHVIVPRWGGPTWKNTLEQMPMMSWLFITWALLYFALASDAARRDRELQLAQATAAAIDAQHRLLLQQIHPHFLFNTLNTISSFVTSRPEEARGLITELAALLRDSIVETDSEFSPLGHECDLAGKYLRIISVRFGERFKPIIDVPESLKTRLVPRGLLLTLVENAVTHGVSALAGDCSLTMHCTTRYRRLIVEVRNRFEPRIPPPSPGHRGGLATLRRRLQVLYGDVYHLNYGGDRAGIWHTRVVLPVMDARVERAREDGSNEMVRDAVPHRALT